MTQSKVQLVCMPYQNTSLSSLSIALLSSVLKQRGIDSTESYLHFEFSKLIGNDRYFTIAEGGLKSGFIGERLFAESLHGPIKHEAMQQQLESFFGNYTARVEKLERYKTYCLSRIAEVGADLVGFTTSNNQLLPSLWLARLIKETWPDVHVVLGGSACSTPMGHAIKEYYPEIDYVVSGYGEQPLLDLAMDTIAADDRLLINTQRVNLETLPIPDYTAFLQQFNASENDPKHLRLAYESSRGCWWGEKTHCTFCGLNQLEMVFNSKSSERVVSEIRTLWDLYHTSLFATDTILSRVHLKEVLPALAAYEDKPTIFYEIKANMTSQEVQLLKQANITWIQPGIESLSSKLLRHLRKGVTAIQNIALLKWCREQGILVSWNLLCGIPGEEIEDYAKQIVLMEHIPHFTPPQGISPVQIDRYSPYFEQFDQYGWSAIKPYDEYRFLHPHMDAAALHDVAYAFDAIGGNLNVHDYIEVLQKSLSLWKLRHTQQEGLFWDQEMGLFRIKDGEVLVITDNRAVAEVIEHSHEIIGVKKLMELTGCEPKLIEELAAQGIIFREGNQLINLAVRIG